MFNLFAWLNNYFFLLGPTQTNDDAVETMSYVIPVLITLAGVYYAVSGYRMVTFRILFFLCPREERFCPIFGCVLSFVNYFSTLVYGVDLSYNGLVLIS